MALPSAPDAVPSGFFDDSFTANQTARYDEARSIASEQEQLDMLQLIRSENVGPITFYHLLKRYGSAADALHALPELAKRGGSKRPIRMCERGRAESEYARLQQLGAHLLTYTDSRYPDALRHLTDAPPVLIAKGQLEALQTPDCIAIVGARNASANGCNFARKLATELAQSGFTIASGLARGIDTHAHTGAMAHRSIGVIANGIDITYPPENANLYEAMQERGIIVTEQPPGMAPFKGSFHGRNRIISGLARGTVIVEAAKRSGSLITAHCAADQNRDVFAVPGSPLDPRCHGTNNLLKNGATLIESADDILQTLRRPELVSAQESYTHHYEPATRREPKTGQMEAWRTAIEETLSATPTALDSLAAQSRVPMTHLLTILLEKELAGLLQRHPGNRVSAVYMDDQ